MAWPGQNWSSRRKGNSPQTRKEGHQGVEYLRCGLCFQVTGARPPGFIAAELVLLRRGQIAVATVGQFNGEGLLEGTLLLDRQPGFREDLARDRRNAQIPDAHGLD